MNIKRTTGLLLGSALAVLAVGASAASAADNPGGPQAKRATLAADYAPDQCLFLRQLHPVEQKYRNTNNVPYTYDIGRFGTDWFDVACGYLTFTVPAGQEALVDLTAVAELDCQSDKPASNGWCGGLKTGAVNTLVVTAEGYVRGENTDVLGFGHALRAVGAAGGRGKRAVVLGAGGSARAVVGVLLAAGYAVEVLNRSSGRAAVLVSHLHRHFPGAVLGTGPIDPAAVVARAADAAVLVQTTSVGAASDVGASLWPLDVPVPSGLVVVDLVAAPAETALVRHARSTGARAEGGLAMLIHQAAAAFTLWTGVPAPVEVMRCAAEAWSGSVGLEAPAGASRRSAGMAGADGLPSSSRNGA